MNKNPALAVALLVVMGLANADEGMWTIDNFPSGQVANNYDVEIDDDWLRAAQLATTRLENGCTGSFASPDGLVLTNNHCVWSCIRNLSSAERNLSDEGFMAVSREQELRCPGQQVSVLIDLDDVTSKVAEATKALDDAEANEARKHARAMDKHREHVVTRIAELEARQDEAVDRIAYPGDVLDLRELRALGRLPQASRPPLVLIGDRAYGTTVAQVVDKLTQLGHKLDGVVDPRALSLTIKELENEGLAFEDLGVLEGLARVGLRREIAKAHRRSRDDREVEAVERAPALHHGVEDRAHDLAGLGVQQDVGRGGGVFLDRRRSRVDRLRDSEVENFEPLRVVLADDEQVGGLEVAVDDPALVAVLHGVGHLGEELEARAHAERAGLGELVEVEDRSLPHRPCHRTVLPDRVAGLDDVATYDVRARFEWELRAAEWIFTALFTVEYVLRLYTSPMPWRAI